MGGLKSPSPDGDVLRPVLAAGGWESPSPGEDVLVALALWRWYEKQLFPSPGGDVVCLKIVV